MGDGSSSKDDDLLARLNALKHSNVSLDLHPQSLALPVEAGTDDSPEDLIARFQRIHGKVVTAGRKQDGEEPSAPSDGDRAPSPTIEELLADLGPEEDYTVQKSDIEEAQALMAEASNTLLRLLLCWCAKNALPAETEPVAETNHSQSIDKEDKNDGESNEPSQAELEEDREAQEALQRILDEADNEMSEDAAAESHAKPPPVDSFAALQFPSTPDSRFEGPDLPSAPTAAPTRKEKAKAKAKPPTDQEIETWCVICCNDASVKCFGCDKDLYCWGCWREGHMGEDAGLEEKAHVWERYKKPKF